MKTKKASETKTPTKPCPVKKSAVEESAVSAEAPADSGKRQPSPMEAKFLELYEKFLQEQRVKLEELKKQFPDDPAAMEYLDGEFAAIFEDPIFIYAYYGYWMNYKVLPNAIHGSKASNAREKGTEATKANAAERKNGFQKLYLETQKVHSKKETKAALIEAVRQRFEEEFGPLSLRTAWSYADDLK